MAYDIVTLNCAEEGWETALRLELVRLEAEGWTVSAMTTKTVQIQQTMGMGAVMQDEAWFVLVVHKSGEA